MVPVVGRFLHSVVEQHGFGRCRCRESLVGQVGVNVYVAVRRGFAPEKSVVFLRHREIDKQFLFLRKPHRIIDIRKRLLGHKIRHKVDVHALGNADFVTLDGKRGVVHPEVARERGFLLAFRLE